jgi:group I intron endonuclease
MQRIPARRNQRCSLYLLINDANGKIYVGQSWYPLTTRMGKDGSNYRHSTYLYNAIQKYGADNFHYEVVAECCDQESADWLETCLINQYDSRNHDIGYNLKEGGSAGIHSEETKKKISETLKAQAAAWTPEHLAERAAPIVGWWTGKERGPMDPEHKAIVIKTLVPGGHEGHHHTDEAKARIGLSSKGRKMPPESVAAGAKKRQLPKEKERDIIQAYKEGMTIVNIEVEFQTGRSSIYRILDRNGVPRDSGRNTWEGKTHSQTTKNKMSKARKRYWSGKDNK